MHHLAADVAWSDETVLDAVAVKILPTLVATGEPIWWNVDDKGFSK